MNSNMYLFKMLISDEDQNEQKVAINEVDEPLQKELSNSFVRTSDKGLERFDRTLKKELAGTCNPLCCTGRKWLQTRRMQAIEEQTLPRKINLVCLKEYRCSCTYSSKCALL